MIRLLLFAIFGFLVYTIVFSLLRLIGRKSPGAAQDRPAEKSPQGEEMVKDPVCGTYLPRGEALQRPGPEGPVYFCSNDCAEQYRKDTQP